MRFPVRTDVRCTRPNELGFDSRKAHHRRHVCIVRVDLPIGVLAAQLIHAAGESAEGVEPGTHAIALRVANERELEHVEARLQRLDVPHAAIREPDSPWHGALMAIGIYPTADARAERKVTRSLKLLK